MEAVVFILVFVVLWAWIEIVRSKQNFREQIAALSHRLWTVEKQLGSGQIAPAARAAEPAHAPAPSPVPHAAPPPVPVMTTPPVQHTPPPVPPTFIPPAPVVPPAPFVPQAPAPVFAQAATSAAPPPLPHTPSTPPPMPPPTQPPHTPQPSFMESLGGKDWEALIGGNLLNKVGALLVVIGVMWFLASYDMGRVGRAACAVVVSLAFLGFGVWLERRETYRIIARSLIGAGWAALYATAYAVYAIPAARIIENPFVGSFLVLLVAAGMIGHSLRYHAQGVTAVAFFSAFAALGVTPSTTFAVISLVPLAIGVLYLAHRFQWYYMALLGVFATYGACAWRGASGAPIYESEALFLVYWVMFEVFDIMRFSQRIRGWAVELIFPLNAAGFLGLSYLSWTSKEPTTVWMLSAICASIYLVSTLWRLKIEIDRGFEHKDELSAFEMSERIRAGSYEAPLVLAAFLTATAIIQKLTGMWMSTALAMEAQAIYGAGIRFRARFLRILSCLAFVLSVAHIFDDARDPLMINVLGHMTHAWVLIVLFHALLFYVNRYMSPAGSIIGIGFGWAGSLMLAVALGNELPVHLVGTGWLVFGAILFELGIRKTLREFRLQAYLLSFFGAVQSLSFFEKAPEYPWLPLAFGVAFTYAAAWRAGGLQKNDPQNKAANLEWSFAEWASCAFTALFATVLIVKQVPDRYAGASLWGLALVLLGLGLQKLPARLRLFSYPVAALATLATFGDAPTRLVKFAPPQNWVPVFLAAAAAWIMSGLLTTAPPESATTVERNLVRSILSGVGLAFAMIAFWIVVPDEFVPAAWAAVGLAVLEAGVALNVPAFRWQAQALAIYSTLAAFGLTLPEGHTHRIIAVTLLVVVLIAFRFLSAGRTDIEAKVPMVHEAASAILVAALIYQEVSGGLLTVAWGAEALALLGVGFVFRERPLRLQGLSLFLVCVLKLFLYDLRNLETPYRILSFIALGLILLGVSWIYTRFREQLQKLL